MLPKIRHIIHQVSFGGEQPRNICDLMASVRAKNLGWHIQIWDERNIAELGLSWPDLIDKCQNFASVSNIVRLHAVFQHGGFYIDTDVRCLKPLEPLLAHAATAAFQTPTDNRICNAIFSADAGHPWLKWQIDRQDTLKDADAAKGVYLMTDAPRYFLELVPTHYYYPIGWENPPAERNPPPDSYTDHYWSGSWTKKS